MNLGGLWIVVVLLGISLADVAAQSPTRRIVQLYELPADAIADPWTSGLDSTRAVVRSARDWQALWAPDPARYPVPSVDLTRRLLLVAVAGERPGHGHRIKIDEAYARGDTLFVLISEYVGCATTGMLVRPIHVVSVDRTADVVQFLDGPEWREVC